MARWLSLHGDGCDVSLLNEMTDGKIGKKKPIHSRLGDDASRTTERFLCHGVAAVDSYRRRAPRAVEVSGRSLTEAGGRCVRIFMCRRTTRWR